MGDLKTSRMMYLKAILFLVIGTVAVALLLLRHPEWKVAALLALAIWACCRAYYFAFYVVEHYIDGEYKFAGLIDFLMYLRRRRK